MLSSDRLVILPLTPADLDETAALISDPVVMRYVPGGAADRPTAASMLEETRKQWRRDGYGLWAIRDTVTGAFLGEGGLQRWTHLVYDSPGVEVDFGYTFGRRNWGKGVATEAMTLIRDHAWDRYEGDAMHALVDADNTRSIRVLEKLDFRRIDKVEGDETELEIWQLDRPA